MGRALKILLIVAALWLGLQLMLGENPLSGESEQAGENLLKRTEATVRRDMESGAERREALLPD